MSEAGGSFATPDGLFTVVFGSSLLLPVVRTQEQLESKGKNKCPRSTYPGGATSGSRRFAIQPRHDEGVQLGIPSSAFSTGN